VTTPASEPPDLQPDPKRRSAAERHEEGGIRPGSIEDRSAAAYLDAALDCVIVADSSGCVLEFNPAAERTFGYKREEVLGQTLAELIVPPHLRERHTRAFERFVQTGE
jgi:PAS domain-containing protein